MLVYERKLNEDEYFMRIALDEARAAMKCGEVPVGAVLVRDNEVLVRTHNMCETENNPLCHAEFLALEKLFKMGVKREEMKGFTLYVTLEPCVMCAATIMIARLGRLVYGARDEHLGGIESLLSLANEPAFKHNIKVKGNVLAEESVMLLKSFFANVRKEGVINGKNI